MSIIYDVNEFNEVVPCINGRRSNDTTCYRELTDFERQLIEEKAELEKELLLTIEKFTLTDKQNTQLKKNCHTCLTRFKCIDPNKNGCVEWK